MENRIVKFKSKESGTLNLHAIPGHFATTHSHINYYVDMTFLKSRKSEAENAAKILAQNYKNSTYIDTNVCMHGCQIIAAYLAEEIIERGLRDQIKLKAGIFGAEAWSEEMRQDIQNKLGIKAYDIYGLTEISGPGVSFECSDQHGMHINEDNFIPEIIDPEDRKSVV